MTRSRRLGLELLEARDVPAGNVTAAVTNGVLTITGDEADNALWFQISPAAVIINPFGGTSVNGQPADAQVTLPGALGLSADLGEGDDKLNLFGASDVVDASVDLSLPKGVKVSLGDGENSLNLITTGTLDLASLTVSGGDGFDLVRVGGGVGKPNKIAGTASFKPGDGGSSTRLSNIDLPGSAGLKLTAGIGDDELILTDATVKKAVTAKLGQGEFNNVSVTGGSIGGLTATSLGGTLKLTNTTVNGNASFTGAAYPEADMTGSTVTGTLTVKSTQPLVGDAIAHFDGTGALGGVVIDAVNNALVYFGSASSYSVTRNMTATSRNRSVLMTFDGAALTARSLSATSKVAGSQMYVSNGSQLHLGGSLTLSAVVITSLQLDTGSAVTATGDVKVTTATQNANFFVTESALTARNVSVTSKTGSIYAGLSGANPASIDLTGRLTLTGGSQVYWGQPDGTLSPAGGMTVTGVNVASLVLGGGSLATAGDLRVTSRDSALCSETGAATTLVVGGNLTVRSDFGQMSFSATGQSLSVGGGTTLDGGYNSQIDIGTTDFSTFTGPVLIKGGTRAAQGSNKKSSLAQIMRLRKANLFWTGKDASFEYKGKTKLVVAGSRQKTDSNLPGDVQIGDPAGPVTVAGNFVIQTAGNIDTIDLRAVTVTGNTVISTGGGNDSLTIDDGCAFTSTFTTDLGSGDDTIAIAQDTAQAAPVTFTGKATINTGAGADTLLLGLLAGDANSRAVFVAAGSKIDGGTGINSFDDELGQFDGLILGTGILGWTDPTP